MRRDSLIFILIFLGFAGYHEFKINYTLTSIERLQDSGDATQIQLSYCVNSVTELQDKLQLEIQDVRFDVEQLYFYLNIPQRQFKAVEE